MPEMTDTQARQCAAFLKALRRTGNVSLSAQETGIHRNTFDKRRRRHPDFATEWDAAIAFAEAHLIDRGAAPPRSDAAITSGGEYSVRATRGRRMQVRRAKPGLLTPAGERMFLAHLAATANVRLSAAATGIGWNAIYARRRNSAAFARAMELALVEGYERLEGALLANAIASLEADGTDLAIWRDETAELPEPMERMSVSDALQLLGYRRPNIVEGKAHEGFKVERSSLADAEAALHKALDQAQARRRRDRRRG
ncbi:hypothetical protein [Sphingomonas sp.]|jgi:hypothetical protein|uniref:hypothetical protein n=1 Tax=Sphingomonas sp. TaxID=28214 RepID=UPI002ED95692